MNVEFEPIRITGVIKEEIGTPRNDGTRGSALYAVPFRLSRRAPREWALLFEKTWDRPPTFTTVHSPGIARISGDRVILDGTTIEEVERVHLETLKLVAETVNEKYAEFVRLQREQEHLKEARAEEHEQRVHAVVDRLKFD